MAERFITNPGQVRAITVKQPYASQIIYGVPRHTMPGVTHKDVENRSWPTDYRGPLIIHAAVHAAAEDQAVGMPKRACLGVVILADCHRADLGCHRVPDTCCGGAWANYWSGPETYDDRPWHWVLSDPRPFERPIQTRGWQSLWVPPKRAQIGAWTLSGGRAAVEQLRMDVAVESMGPRLPL